MRDGTRTGAAILAVGLLFASGPAAARTDAVLPAPATGDFVIRDFHFVSGERMPELVIHYRTLGSLRRNRDGRAANAVLLLHGTTGSGAQFLAPNFAGVLFGPGQLLDASRWYIVLPDGIGHGGSSRPSDRLHARFPRYTYDDMVAAQYRLLTEGLRVDHLRLVLGTSMGGMHTWIWAETHPDFADGLVPLACLPAQIAGRNRVFRRMIVDDIRNDPGWESGEYRTQPRGLSAAIQILLVMVSSPLQWQKAAPDRDAADRFLAEQMRARMASADANDFLYAFEASRDYDPSPALERITAPVLAINSADDVINSRRLAREGRPRRAR